MSTAVSERKGVSQGLSTKFRRKVRQLRYGGLTIQLRAGRDAVGVGGRDHSSSLVGDGHEIIVDLLQVDVRHFGY